MKKFISIFPLLFVALLVFAQGDDLSISVRKKPVITIEPDSMYFYSHTSRQFKIRNVPTGYIIKGDFMGWNFIAHDNTFILKPSIVYKDSDVLKYGRRGLFNGENVTSGEFYITQVHLKIFDDQGMQIDSIVRNCYIKPEPYNPPDYTIDVSSSSNSPVPIGSIKKEKRRKLKQ